MGEKDIKAKNYLNDNERFADLCNYYFYRGMQVLKPEDLEEQDTTEVLSVFGVNSKEIQLQKWRDLLKKVIIKRTKSCNYVIIGIENQSDIHYAMPVRNMIYDVINYGNQVKEAAKGHKADKRLKMKGEFLSGFSREDRLTPVVTLTVYWGTDPWDGPRSLHEMLMPDALSLTNYVADYHLNLIEPYEMTDFEKFRTSLGAVLEMIKYADDEKKMEHAIMTRAIYHDLEQETVKTIAMFTGMEIEIESDREDVKMDMCKAWEDHKQEGVREGISQGEDGMIRKMYQNGMSMQNISLITGMTEQRIRDAIKGC